MTKSDSGKRVSNTMVTYLREEDSLMKVRVILHDVLVFKNQN